MRFAAGNTLKAITLISLVLFLMQAGVSIWRGTLHLTRRDYVTFWERQQWHELKALAGNLDRLGQADAQVLCLGLLACEGMQQKAGAEFFAAKLLQEKVLNLRVETLIQKHLIPDSLRKRIGLYRTRGSFALFALLAMLNVLYGIRRAPVLPWITALSISGCLLLAI